MKSAGMFRLLTLIVAIITSAFGVLVAAASGPGWQLQKIFGALLVLFAVAGFLLSLNIAFRQNHTNDDLRNYSSDT